jgi:PhnB protein
MFAGTFAHRRSAMPESMRVAPMLSVRRGAAAVEFYTQAFGATTLFRLDADDGAVVAQLSAGGAEFWVADESPAHQNFSPESLGGSTVRLVLVVDAPHDVVARAVRAGATPVLAVDERNGWLLGRIVDPFGHHWEIGTPLERLD